MLTIPKLITFWYLLLIINYNTISIERLPWKTEIGKVSWYLNNSLLCKPDFSSATENLLSLLKTQESNHSSACDKWKYTKCCFKETCRTFSKNSTTQGNNRIQDWKRGFETHTKKEISNQKLNQLTKVYKMNFIN